MTKTTKRTGEGKRKLLKKKGMEKVPPGKEVHHKKPLKNGGSDNTHQHQGNYHFQERSAELTFKFL